MKKIIISLVGLFTIFIFGMSFIQKSNPLQEYNLNAPSQTYNLPKILEEVSGLTDLNKDEIACIQDELGIVFIFNLKSNKITKEINFGEPADYEGISHINNSIYILRSDGDIIKIEDYTARKIKTNLIKTGISNKDNEGLCFDPKTGLMLIGSKSKQTHKKGLGDLRTIHGYHLDNKKMMDEPILTIKIKDVVAYALKHDIEIPTKSKKGKTSHKVKLGISGVAIHPINHHYYVLSAVDQLLLIIDRSGDIIYMTHLPEKIFPQAEGITFLENGDMYISNEGKDKPPTLFLFKPNKFQED
ncbi:hypothetical protein DNU06_04035 [Putridiphycobacter roseus]|uniref:SdiA-regulated family protein n=1 Tax=Putridiphycobacter roseus TaxID=2219161 RepID=A0A2W1N0N0_9FLAO|nr:SdiA-regulated domain-containing protein [Putridiphycobacter roseus]PZE17797.1 hypothetical protein DNU06_04035 [Putridiphycobacter roseus]